MDETTFKIVSDYYSEMQRGFRNGKLDFKRMHLSDDIAVIGPNERFEGIETVSVMLQEQLLPITERFDFLHQFFDTNQACTLLNCVTKTPAGTVPVAEWIIIRSGKITEIRLFYDTTQWAKVNLPPENQEE
jgi:hypothetical protein